MPISTKDVEELSGLAKLRFSDLEKEKMAKELDQIVIYVEKLNELDTENVEPTSHVVNLKNVLRNDEVEEWLQRREALANAPSAKNGYFCVPKVIG